MTATKPSRADPFAALDVSDFKPAPAAALRPKPAAETTRAVSEAAGFTSREPSPAPVAVVAPAGRKKAAPKTRKVVEQRRHRTGRNIPLNIKVTADQQARFLRIADEQNLVQGILLERALDAYEAQHGLQPDGTQPASKK